MFHSEKLKNVKAKMIKFVKPIKIICDLYLAKISLLGHK